METPTCETCRFARGRPIANEMASGNVYWTEDLPECRHPDSPICGDLVEADFWCGEHQPRENDA